MSVAKAYPYLTFRIGHTYAHTTDKSLVDPTVQHVEKLVLADRSKDDHLVKRPPLNENDKLESWFKNDSTCYKHPVTPGVLPRQHGLFGQSYGIWTSEALSDFEQQQKKDRMAGIQLRKYHKTSDKKNWGDLTDKERFRLGCTMCTECIFISFRGGSITPSTSHFKIIKSEFKLPLLMIRPECATLLRNLPMDEPPLAPPDHFPSPYFMENPDLQFSKQGYSNKVPFGYASFGRVNQATTNSELYDFTSNYRKRLSTEWAPVSISRPDPPLLIQPSEIYHRHVGHLPNYAGHIPGAIFRFGKTYGNDTRDAKRWLRGDFTT